MEEIYKPSTMEIVMMGGTNYGDYPEDEGSNNYERAVYTALMFNFAAPESDNIVILSGKISQIRKRLKEFGSVNLHAVNVSIVKQILTAFPECENMLRKYEYVDLNPYVDEAKAGMH